MGLELALDFTSLYVAPNSPGNSLLRFDQLDNFLSLPKQPYFFQPGTLAACCEPSSGAGVVRVETSLSLGLYISNVA